MPIRSLLFSQQSLTHVNKVYSLVTRAAQISLIFGHQTWNSHVIFCSPERWTVSCAPLTLHRWVMKVKPFQNRQIWEWKEQKVIFVQVACKDSQQPKKARQFKVALLQHLPRTSMCKAKSRQIIHKNVCMATLQHFF